MVPDSGPSENDRSEATVRAEAALRMVDAASRVLRENRENAPAEMWSTVTATLREGVGMYRELLSEGLPDADLGLAHALNGLGHALFLQDRARDAEICFRECMAVWKQRLDRGDLEWALALEGVQYRLAVTLILQRRRAEALALLRERVAVCRRLVASQVHGDRSYSITLQEALVTVGRPEAAPNNELAYALARGRLGVALRELAEALEDSVDPGDDGSRDALRAESLAVREELLRLEAANDIPLDFRAG